MSTIKPIVAKPDDFVIVKFLNSPFKELNNNLAVVPVKYTKFNQLNNDFHTKYSNPPYGPEDLSLVENIIKSNSPAPDSWTSHKCIALRCFSKFFLYNKKNFKNTYFNVH